MTWKTHDKTSKNVSVVDEAKAKLYNEIKNDCLPVVTDEANKGVKPFKAIEFQPVKSIGRYEAEFGVKGEDLIFHFWPWGYHEAERDGVARPRFESIFERLLLKALEATFDGKRVSSSFDPDMGSFFVVAKGYASNQFHRELAIKACEGLHKLMGGTV